MARFAQGKYSLKNPAKYIGTTVPTYRSSWEFAFMRFCDEHASVRNWASEAVKIPYRNPLSGKFTIYVPDFFITYVNAQGKQHVELIEVKPASQTLAEAKTQAQKAAAVVNQAKWAAARAWCKQKGIFFRVITEGDIFHKGRRG